MTSDVSFLNKYRRLLAWTGGILVTYALLGFLFLPWFAERQLVKILGERLNLQTRVEAVYFNPFSFFFELEGLDIADVDNTALVQLENIHANFQASQLAFLKFQFEELSISGVDFHFYRDSETGNNLSRLLQRWDETAEPDPEAQTSQSDESGELIPLEVISLDIANVNLHVVDEVPATAFATTLTLAEASINNLSTLEGELGNNSIAIGLEQNARIDWAGDFSLNPMAFTGTLALQGLSLNVVSRYLQDSVPFTIEDGRMGLALAYQVDLSVEPIDVSVDDIALDLTNLQVIQSGQSQPFLLANSLNVTNGQLHIPDNRVTFEDVILREFDISLIRNSEGEMNLQSMVSEFIGDTDDLPPANSDEPSNTDQPWLIALETFTVDNGSLSFTDASLAQPVSLSTSLDTTVTDIDNQADSQFPFSSTLNLESGGDIGLQGNLQILPAIDFNASLSVNNITLTPVQAYLNEVAFIELQSSSVSLDAELVVNTNEPFAYQGNFVLQDIDVEDQRQDETMVTMNQMSINALSFSTANNSLDISEILFDLPFARVVVNEDGTTNIARSIKPSSTSATNPPDSNTDGDINEALEITVGRVRVESARSNFTDKSVPLIFDTNIQELSGSAESFGTNSTQAMEISLEGQVDEFGLVQIDSSLNPFDITEQSKLDLNFRNLDMPAISPYAIKFAAREIANGRVDVGLSYSINDGELEANNQVVLRDLTLGERIEHPGAMDLPLDLATALLKDANGIIDLEVPISGNVNDPEFSIGPVIRQAITNSLTNIVTAPFRLLGNLLGGEGADLDSIKFLRMFLIT